MLDDKKASQARLAMERLGRPLSSYPRTGKIAKTISHKAMERLDKAIEPKIRQNEIERRESFESAKDVIVGGKQPSIDTEILIDPPKQLRKAKKENNNS